MARREDLKPQMPPEGELKWLYEHVVEWIPGLARLPARTSVLIQLLLMEGLGLALGRAFAVEPMALARGSLLILAVAIWSQLLLVVAPRLRSPVVMARAEMKAGVMAAYRRWLFHPRHLEAVPGSLMFLGAWIMLIRGPEGSMPLEQMLGRTPTPLLLLPLIFLSWDVCYRLGVGLWVAGFSAWRAVVIWRASRAGPPACALGSGRAGTWATPGHILPTLGLKFLRRMDRTLLLFPLTNAFILPLFLPWPMFFYHLAAVTAATALFGLLALAFDRPVFGSRRALSKSVQHKDGSAFSLGGLGTLNLKPNPPVPAPPTPLDTLLSDGPRTVSKASRSNPQAPRPSLAVKGLNRDSLGPLRDGARVAIIGAGPAGSLCAHFLSRLASREGRELHLTLFDYKDFSLSGPQGCNMCAGVISGSLSRHLEEAEIALPPHIVQSRITAYRVVNQSGETSLSPPAGAREIVTVFRGNGPKYAPVIGNVSFDDFLLENARSQGVEVIEQAVRGLSLPTRPTEPAVLLYGHGESQREMEVEAVVGAFGLSGNMPSLLNGLGSGYLPPESIRACQTEVAVGADHISQIGGDQILVFSLGLPGITFAALTPKKAHFTATLVGKEPVKIPDLVAFLRHPRVREFLPQDWEPPTRLCHCHPLLAVTGARSPFADRLVVIGDASYCRYFKNGLESAFHTALFAAQTMFHYGISKETFRQRYYPACRKEIIRDNAYGKLLFTIQEKVGSSTRVAQAQMSLFQGHSPSAQAFQRAAWDLLTGERPYRHIASQLIRPRVVFGFLRRLLKSDIQRRKPPDLAAGT